MLDALSNRFGQLVPLRRDGGLLVARARLRGTPVMLWHQPLADPPAAQASRTVAERLQAAGGFGSPIEWHEGAAGVTWVLPEDGGEFLDEWAAAAGTVPIACALSLLHDLAQALEQLHRERILHLRLRPACVRIVGGQRPVARLLAAEAVPLEQAGERRHDSARDDLRHTAPELSGRTGTLPDARTDLYLLGLLAWELLAGRLPFTAGDTLGWLHAHLAQEPADLASHRPDLPAGLVHLLASLLAKTPQQRPASARAVAEDLQRFIDALEAQRPIQELASHAPLARFALPRLLVGREREHEILRAAFARAEGGSVETVVLFGPSGIGKSTLAAALAREAGARGALVATAKFEQLGSGRPYPALGELLSALGRQLPAMPAPSALAASIGPEAAALSALSPEFARCAGLPLAEAELAPDQARQRLLVALQRLLATLAGEHPLVLLLDDLQWSDGDTLPLLAAALRERGLGRVLLLAALRDDAPAATDLLAPLAPLAPLRLALEPLPEPQVRRWLEAALSGGLVHPDATLARLALRSGGNPLFLGQLLNAMVLQGQLVPDAAGRWRLDERPAAWEALPDTVLEAMHRRLEALGEADAALLGMAAALGTRFDAGVLERARGSVDVQQVLRRAAAEGLLESHAEGGRWRFVHDRLQQAAYEAGSPGQRQQWHLRLGRVLRGQPGPDALFDACRHLNAALPLMDADERADLARLNHQAGLQARSGAGFAQYAASMRAALGALPGARALPREQQLALLHDAAEAAILAREFEQATACLEQAQPLASGTLELARADELRIQWLIARERTEEALALGLSALGRLGVHVDPARASLQTLWQLAALKWRLRAQPPDTLLQAPHSQDPQHLLVQRLTFASISVAHTLGSRVYAVLGLRGARDALEHGITPWSWLPVSAAGHVLAGVFGDIDTGYRLGEVSTGLGSRFGSHALSFNHLFYLMHWKVPVVDTLPLLRQCAEQAERAGNFEIANYAMSMYVGVTWNAMGSLLAVEDALQEARALGQRRSLDLTLDCCDTFTWLLGLLRGPRIEGTIASYRRTRADGRERGHDGIFDLIHDQLAVMLNVTTGHFGDDVVAISERVGRNLHRLGGNFSTPLHHWFEALLHAERLHEAPRAASRRLVRGHLRKLRAWSAHCPANHSHRVASLEAELAALAGERDASERFAQAVRLAREHGFVGDAAIIAHRWARHGVRAGDPDQMRQAMELAHGLFAQWGATAMVQALEEALPSYARVRAPHAPVPVDTATLVKASQAISAELDMGSVAERLLEQVMENAGARYAALVLRDGDRLRLAAQRAVSSSAAREPAGAVLEDTMLPQALLRHVLRTQATVALEDATAVHAFGRCERWRQSEGISVLCVPVLAAGSAVGALYLENELAPGCFTPEGARLAHVLAAQAAIAISNAKLFAELGAARDRLHEANVVLEQRVSERTRALEANHRRLLGMERQLAVDEERRRIMRDLHDGLGSQLFVTLSRVERQELAPAQVGDALRACIADMRLVLEAMGPDSNDFLEAWGNFRFRWDEQLRNAGLAAEWRMQVPDDALEVPAPATLQLLRIAQEALTNVLKHAGASRVTVRLAYEGDRLLLAIEDDGRGLAASAGSAGRGLANMQARATRLAAELALEPLERGTRVRLELPLR